MGCDHRAGPEDKGLRMTGKPIHLKLNAENPEGRRTADSVMETAAVVPQRVAEAAFEPLYLVLIHNDDVTPYEYVLQILARVFLLSEEIAEHVAWTAHNDGQAVVIIRPRAEAKRLLALAQSRARLDGYPLAFSMEPEA